MLGFRQHVAAAEADDFRAAFRNDNGDRRPAPGEYFFPPRAALLEFHRVDIRLRNHAAVGFSPAVDTDSRDRLRVAGAGGPDDDRADLTAHRGGGGVCAHGAPEVAACTGSIASARTLTASNALSATEVVTDGDTRCVSGGAQSALERGLVMDSGTGAKGADAHDGQTVLQGVKLSPSHRIWAIIASLAGSVRSSRP